MMQQSGGGSFLTVIQLPFGLDCFVCLLFCFKKEGKSEFLVKGEQHCSSLQCSQHFLPFFIFPFSEMSGNISLSILPEQFGRGVF